MLLADQDRARWDHLLIRRGLAALARAEGAGGGAWAVCAAGGDRSVPCACDDRGEDGLAAHRRAL